MPEWLLVVVLVLQAHFAASYLVPLDAESRGAFRGLLPWFWPWAHGDGGPLGRVTAQGFPLPGFFLAVTAAGAFILAALAVAGLWVPGEWGRPLAVAGAALLLALMALFFSATKVIPMGVAAAAIYVALATDAFATAT